MSATNTADRISLAQRKCLALILACFVASTLTIIWTLGTNAAQPTDDWREFRELNKDKYPDIRVPEHNRNRP